ncbi:hypothetical protein FOJ82_00730 [Tessaracoccus rhinocerotis]|uniref:Uncharacterized protein n=1 Tax=Tessaracoccus rhinocerotis TaxID=1689449 RepID=A0A553K429_9ACTN|nr:hypothetical protein [Tessaracoccus rhinocerotis]TRY19469.1 hypothetical protein FOJ82_00730 [Tessaracoccus rhinocerotis]
MPEEDHQDEPVVVLLGDDAATGAATSRPPSHRLLMAGIIGTVLGAGITAAGFLAGTGTPEPIAVTWDTFPEEVLGLAREDIGPARMGTQLRDRYDEYLRRQLELHRFAHGGDGAEVAYGGPNGEATVRLTIVNGSLAPPVPWLTVGADGLHDQGQRTVVIGEVRCTVEVYYFSSADAQDTVRAESPNCVLNDEARGLGLRLRGTLGSYWGEGHDAGEFAEELVALHSWLVG